MPLDAQQRLQRELALEKEIWTRRCRTDLTAWAIHALANYSQTPARHHKLLIAELEAVARGETDRLMIFMPPGHAKSFYTSILFPPWLMIRGKLDIIGASHGADLAEDFSWKALRLIGEHTGTLGYGLLNESSKLWRTTNGCVYRAAGAGGSITGRRADYVIIDDPYKGRQEADSETVREAVWRWYCAEVITRLKPGGRIILIQTRWHEDDLGGRLLQEMQGGGDQWRVIDLPALAGESDPLGRMPGEALWPEWEDEIKLARKRAAIGEREWAALFQQRPAPAEGAIFRVAKIATLDAAPAMASVVRAWDLASTEATGGRDPDHTVGLKLGKTAEGRYVILDVVDFCGGPDAVDAAIKNTANQEPDVPVSLPQDPGAAGKARTLYLTRMLAGRKVFSSPESGDKATRAAPLASQCNVGNLAIVRAPWNRPLLDQLAAFPNARHDDAVDAASRAFMHLVTSNAGPMQFVGDLAYVTPRVSPF